MKKVLMILSDSNKGKFISKSFSSAFRKLSFFVFEKKVYDLNIDEINKIAPDIIFIFWSDNRNKTFLEKFFFDKIENVDFIHCAEYKNDIPSQFYKEKNHYIFSCDAKNKKNKFIFSIISTDYKADFQGYKYNISFCGNPNYEKREIILSELIKNFGEINIFCRSFDFYKSVDDITKLKLLDDYDIETYRKSYKGYVNSTKDLSHIYISSKINVDIQNTREKTFNYRLLEITASGGFIISPYNKDIVKQYDNGKDIETYKDIFELTDKINFYLKNINLAKSIAQNGKRNTVSNFSSYDILKKIMKVIYGKDFSSR